MDSKIKKLVAGVALAGALTVGTAGRRGRGRRPRHRPRSVGADRHGTPGCGTRSARPR